MSMPFLMTIFRFNDDRGAAAVEFAFIAMIFITLVFGGIELGRAYNAQITLSAAAREGARVMAVQNDLTAAVTATLQAAPSLDQALTAEDVNVDPAVCSAGQDVTVTATYPVPFITGLFGDGPTLTGRGVMRCGG